MRALRRLFKQEDKRAAKGKEPITSSGAKHRLSSHPLNIQPPKYEFEDNLTIAELVALHRIVGSLAGRLGLQSLDFRLGHMTDEGFTRSLDSHSTGLSVNVQCRKTDRGAHKCSIESSSDNAYGNMVADQVFHVLRLALVEFRKLQNRQASSQTASSSEVEELWQRAREMMHDSPDEALEILEQIAGHEPQNGRAFARMVYIHHAVKKNPVQAISIGSDFLKLTPVHPGLVEQMGMTYLDIRQFNKALDVFTLIEPEDANPSTLGCLEIMYRLLGEASKAFLCDVLFMLKAPGQGMSNEIHEKIHLAHAIATKSVEVRGFRFCSVCGECWESTTAMLKDSGMLQQAAHYVVTVDPADLKGLTCTKCSESFCRLHLGQDFPSQIPGGHCPTCGAPLDLA